MIYISVTFDANAMLLPPEKILIEVTLEQIEELTQFGVTCLTTPKGVVHLVEDCGQYFVN